MRTVPRPYILPTSLFWASALFLGLGPVSWHLWAWEPISSSAGPPQDSMKLLSREKQLHLVMAEAGLATYSGWCSVVTQPLEDHSFAQAALRTALGFGVAGKFCLWKPASVQSPTLQCSITNISTGKSKGLCGGRWMNKAKVGFGTWNWLHHKQNGLLTPRGKLSLPTSWKDALTTAIDSPEELGVYLLE